MAFLKSKFSKFHLSIALFAAVNILLGLAMAANGGFYRSASTIHYFSGLLIFLCPILVLMILKERNMVWKAFTFRLGIHKKDIGNVKVLLGKIVVWLFLVSLVLSGIIAMLVKSGVGASLFPHANLFLIHTKAIYIVVPLLALHIITMMITKNNNKGEAR